MRKFLLLLAGFSMIFGATLRADEGMWLLPLLQKLNIGTMQKMGLKLNADDIYSVNHSSLKDAVVIFGGGCTGELVSDQGLLLTNHHCGYDAIQSHSTVEHDYLANGFWATSKDQELTNPDLSVTFLVRMEDVTDKMLSALSDTMSEDSRNKAIMETGAKLSDEATKGTAYHAMVQDFFAGNNFYLVVYETYKDVRLVGTPPSSIGKFGADTDNWMWPRHTGDFSVFRVYSAPDGSPAPYSPDNVPLKPKKYLPVSLKGVEKGDFTMVMGYPGSTDRYMTSYGVNQLLEVTHPNRIKIRGERQEILMKDMQANPKVRIQYASKYSRSSNYWKYSIGQSEGLKRLKVVQKKKEQEDQFKKWISESAEREQKYGEALTMIKDAYLQSQPYENATQYLFEAIFRGTESATIAIRTLALYNTLKEEPDNTSKIKSIADRIKESLPDFYKDYNEPTDKKVAVAMLRLVNQNVPAIYKPDIFNVINGKYKGDVAKFVDKLYSKSIFPFQDKLEAFLDDPDLKTLEKDPAFQLARTSYLKYMELRALSSDYDNELEKGQRLYMAGLMEMKQDHVFYPDANFTMRLTYGKVGDYSPEDAVLYKYYTTLKGVMEKEDSTNWEFVVPGKLKELYNAKDYGRYGADGYMPVCFTTDNDITGGNSGSPVMNANGELIGLAFDGNWEAMSGDIAFEDQLQKTICVDIRYVLFIMDKFAGAKNLVDEMTLVQ